MSAYLQITLRIKNENRAAAAAVYGKYKQPFLEENARAYLATKLFSNDVVGELKSMSRRIQTFRYRLQPRLRP